MKVCRRHKLDARGGHEIGPVPGVKDPEEAYPVLALALDQPRNLDVSVANPYADFTANFMGRRWPIAIQLFGTKLCARYISERDNSFRKDLRPCFFSSGWDGKFNF